MHLLIVTPLYPSKRAPTQWVFNVNAFAAVSRRCKVSVVAPVAWWRRMATPADLLETPQWAVSPSLNAFYPTHWTIPRVLHQHKHRTLYSSIRSTVMKLHRQEPFDAVLGAWAYPDGVAAVRLARELAVPVSINVLGSDINVLAEHPSLRPAIAGALSEARTVVAVSRALRDAVIRLGVDPRKVRVHHNGVDGERFTIRERSHARASLGLPESGSVILYVGNLVLEKGPDVLLAAAQLLERSGRDFTVVLSGDGVLQSTLKSTIAQLGLGQRVRLLGRKPNVEIADWLAAADVLALPSLREGCPNVVLEALASGRPVVASAVGGVPELLEHGRTGILVPPSSPEQLARGLEQALERQWDPEQLRGSVPFLTWDSYAEALLDAVGIPTGRG